MLLQIKKIESPTESFYSSKDPTHILTTPPVTPQGLPDWVQLTLFQDQTNPAQCLTTTH